MRKFDNVDMSIGDLLFVVVMEKYMGVKLLIYVWVY